MGWATASRSTLRLLRRSIRMSSGKMLEDLIAQPDVTDFRPIFGQLGQGLSFPTCSAYQFQGALETLSSGAGDERLVVEEYPEAMGALRDAQRRLADDPSLLIGDP